MKDSIYHIKAPETGLYALRVIPGVKVRSNVSKFLYSTCFKVLTRSLPSNLSEVAIRCYEWQAFAGCCSFILRSTEQTTSDSHYQYRRESTVCFVGKYRYLTAAKGNDTAMPQMYLWGGDYNFADHSKPVSVVTLLTDRSVYRPGQTVYVKALPMNSILTLPM